MDRRSIGRAALAAILLLVALGFWTLPWRGSGLRTDSSASGREAGTDLGGSVAPSAGDAAIRRADASAKVAGQAVSPDNGRGVAPGSRVRLKKLSTIDRRAVGASPPATRQADLEELRRSVPGVEVRFDPVTGSPDHILASGRFLTPSAGPEADAASLVKRFMNEHAGIFGHGGAALDTSRVTRDDVTAHNGMRTRVWQQQVDGVPVYQGILKANLTRDGALITLGSHFLQDATAATGLAAGARATLVAQPPVDEKQALSLAAGNLGDAVAPDEAVAASPAEGAERKQRFTAPKLSDIVAQLSWLPLSADSARLTWDVTLLSLKRNEMFRVLVDAQTGEVLMRTSLTNDISDATYRVYADAATKKPHDSPAPMLPGTPTPSGAQGVVVPRSLVTLQALDTTASPNGWINDGGTETVGNNVDAHTDTDANNVADLPRPNGGAGRVFDFAADLSLAPGTYKDAAVTHLFYINNWMHDKLYGLGFTESAGNFQTDNLGRGGSGNDAVQSDAQDGSGTNNANMSTPADGSAPRMQMYVFTGPTPDRDGDFDDVIVLHEYTHGLSNRLVGGGAGISALATGGMGEGWSDFYGLALLADPASDPNAVYPGGSYATLQFVAGMTTNYYFGIRRYPYSTDMSKNPLTFRDIDPTQASPHTGIPLSPLFGSSNSDPSEVHNVGEVWCMALWECRANLIAKHGAAGNQLILQLVTDGMKLCPVNPNLLQSRDAIIQADLIFTGGANRNELWAAFAKRGMGAGATSPASSTTTGVVESYDLPDDLGVTPTGVLLATGDAGGPFAPSANTYTLLNYGAVTVNWTVADNAAWLDLSAASGSLASGAATTVTATLNAAASGLADGLYSAVITFTNTGSGATFLRTVSLRVGQVDYFTEIFNTSAPHDVANQSFLFTPSATTSGYLVRREPVTDFFTNPAGGTSLPMIDDTSVQVTLAGGQEVVLYGVNYPSFHVGSNGYITFGSGDSEYVESPATHFNLPRVAALMDDLLPSTGQVTWRQTADRVAVTWQGVPQYGMSNSNSFQIELFFDGRIRITNLAIAAAEGLIGLSRGTGVPVDFIESDFSGYPVLSLGMSAPAIAVEGDAPFVGTITASAAPASDLIVSLASSDATAATVPATATILAGQTSATFPITIIDDTDLDGTQSTTLTATASGYSGASAVLAVQEDETAVLAVAAPATVIEGASPAQGTVTVSAAPASSVTVNLTSSDPTAATVPATVLIPAGQTSAGFAVTAVDDNKIDGLQNATITAHVANWTDGAGDTAVEDNEDTVLAIVLPATVTEGATGAGTVSISGTLTSALAVSLASADTSRLTVPLTVSIPAGATSAPFVLTGPDNALMDGAVVVGIDATATGFTGAGATTTVLDDDVHHFTVSPVASPQIKGVAFAVSITAMDLNGIVIASYAGAPVLSAVGNAGPASLSPADAGGFVGGVWTGNVTVSTLDTGVVLTVSDGAGHSGASNAFDVGIGPLHHFAWNPVTGPKSTTSAFNTTVTALDAGGNVVTGFEGAAGLSGYVINSGAASVVITEVNPNTPDEIEFMNVSPASVDVSGWTVHLYDDVSWPAPLTVFTIPAGTTCAAGQLFRLQESGSSPGTFPQFYYGANISWTSSGGSRVAVLLRSASGAMVDFVCAGAATSTSITSPAVIPASQWSGAPVSAPLNSNFGYSRIGGSDGSTLANWTTALPGLGTVNPGLTTPFPGPTSPVTISPAVTGSFTGGIWTGDVSVLQAASQMRLRADDGAGHAGDSNAFDVIPSPPAVTTLAAASVSTASATLHATINPNGGATVAKFQRGLTAGYGTDSPVLLAPTNGTTNQNVSVNVTGLTPGTTYHFRASGTNAGGTTNGDDFTFTTVSTNASLSGLALSAGALTPAFSGGTLSYSATVPNATMGVTATPAAANSNATIQARVNGGSYALVGSGSASGPLALNVGANSVEIRVTAQDGVTQKIYTVTVTRNNPYQDWAATVGLSGANAGPLLDPNVNGVPNLLEWAFGTVPLQPASPVLSVSGGSISSRGTPTSLKVGDDYFAAFCRRKDAGTVGLAYTVRFSGDLAGWVVSGVTPDPVADDGVVEVVTIPYPADVYGLPARFFKVEVTGP